MIYKYNVTRCKRALLDLHISHSVKSSNFDMEDHARQGSYECALVQEHIDLRNRLLSQLRLVLSEHVAHSNTIRSPSLSFSQT